MNKAVMLKLKESLKVGILTAFHNDEENETVIPDADDITISELFNDGIEEK